MQKEALLKKKSPAHPLESNIANNLKSLRKKKKLTLERLAELTRFSASYLSRLEVGKRRFNTDILHKLSQVLECHPSDIIDSQGSSPLYIKDLPIYGTRPGEDNIDFSAPLEVINRPEVLAGIKTAFGIYISDNGHLPKYTPGETIFVHPDRPLTQGCSAFAITKKDTIVMGHFEEWAKGDLLLLEFGGSQKFFTIPHASLRVVYRIIGSIERT